MSWECFFVFLTEFSDEKIFPCTASFSSKSKYGASGQPEELRVYGNNIGELLECMYTRGSEHVSVCPLVDCHMCCVCEHLDLTW